MKATIVIAGILNSPKYRRMHDITRRVYDPAGIAPTLHTCGGGNLEPKIKEDMETNEQTLTCASRKRGDTHKIEVGGERANALTSINTDSMVCKTGPKFRIRKLTPRECFRLMDVRDSDIDKIQAAGISNSQQYKMAGNSTVVGVLECIFDRMFIHTQPEAGTQLELF